MDVQSTAEHLARLGCTPAQIGKHLACLARLALMRDARPKSGPEQPRRPRRPGQPLINDQQAATVCALLAQSPHAWFNNWRSHLPWAGEVVCRVLDMSMGRQRDRKHALQVLVALEGMGRIERVAIAGGGGRRRDRMLVAGPVEKRVRLIGRRRGGLSTANGAASASPSSP